MPKSEPIVERFDSPNFNGFSEFRETWLKADEKPDEAEKDNPFIRLRLRTIVLRHKRSKETIRFMGQVRGGKLTFGDSRAGEKSWGLVLKPRYSEPEMRQELARMIGDEN